MRWFGGKAAREAARPALARVAVGVPGAFPASDGPRGYEAQVREAYLGNAVAQRAVRLVAEALAGAPLDASDPGLAALVQGPPPGGGPALLEAVASQLLLHGNAFVAVLADADGLPAALFPLRPERVSVAADAAGWPAAYLYRVGDKVQRFSPDGPRPEVIALRGYHPADDHHGAGSLGAASGAVAIHNAAGRWTRALLANAARPSGALVYDPGDGSAMSPDQFERVRAEMDAAFAGAANAGRPMLLEGGLKWQALSLSPADLDFAETRAAAAREIALAFGVPPMLLGLPGDATYANYKEANRALWRLTVLPMAASVLGALAAGLAGWFPGASMRVALDRVPALADDRAQLWASVSAADFLSVGEKRRLLDLPELEAAP